MSDAIAIRAEGLSKRYRLGAGGSHDSLRDLLASGARALVRGGAQSKGPRPEFYALRDASFEIRRGENVGVIGANGAGKSTLLKILSRITEPTAGRALIAGRVGALLEVGTGFHQELTGRENVFLYGAILGMSRQEIQSKFDAIVDFAEIAQFIDTPVKRYSSGMYVRLAFAVAAHLRPDILLLDEVLAVGDVAFQRKCMAFARDLQKQQATILFVSHNMFSIKTMCSRVIYIRAGRIEFDGATDAGIERYEQGASLSVAPYSKDNPDNWSIVVTGMELLGEDGAPKAVFDVGERMRLRIDVLAREPIESPNIMAAFVRSDGVACSVYASESDGFATGRLDGPGVIEVTTPPLKLVAERYMVHVVIRAGGTQRLLCAQIGRAFHIRHAFLDPLNYGVFHEPAQWRRAEEAESLEEAVRSAAAGRS